MRIGASWTIGFSRKVRFSTNGPAYRSRPSLGSTVTRPATGRFDSPSSSCTRSVAATTRSTGSSRARVSCSP